MSTSDITLDSVERAVPLLNEDGYVLIRNVLSAEDVARAREVCNDNLLSDAEAESEIEATALLQMPELTFMFDERVLEALTTLLSGTLAYYPNYIARLNRFTDWHIDNGFFPKYLSAADHLYDPHFRHVQCVVYLQDNLPGLGGGLDVRPGSHRWATSDQSLDEDDIARIYSNSVSINSKAGDLIVFDGRLMHRGTPTDGSHKRPKFGVFWSASRDDQQQIDRYIEYFEGRVDFVRTLNRPPEEFQREVRRHHLMHTVRFPESYPSHAIAVMRRFSVTVAEMPQLSTGTPNT